MAEATFQHPPSDINRMQIDKEEDLDLVLFRHSVPEGTKLVKYSAPRNDYDEVLVKYETSYYTEDEGSGEDETNENDELPSDYEEPEIGESPDAERTSNTQHSSKLSTITSRPRPARSLPSPFVSPSPSTPVPEKKRIYFTDIYPHMKYKHV